jgi:hypothetical protein
MNGQNESDGLIGLFSHLPPMSREDARALLLRPATPEQQKPTVYVPGHGITISDSSQRLFAVIAPTRQMFLRGGNVVEVVERDTGYELSYLKPVAAQSRFENYVQFAKRSFTSHGPIIQPVNITKELADQYLQSEACRDSLPTIIGVVECPLLIERTDGLHLAQDGYNADTQYFVATHDQVEVVDPAEAVRRINLLIEEFEFLTPGDRSRAIAAFLTPAMKFGGSIQGTVPIDVSEANASQAGKTLRQKLVAAVYHQRLAVVAHQKGGTGSTDEKIADLLIKGRPFIQYDNVRGYLDSQLIESFVTAEEIIVRGPYQPNTTVDATKHILFISSNGLETTKDLSNRSNIVRIVKKENHNFRTFEGLDLLPYVRANYSYFLAAVFAVIRSWHAAGKPRTTETRHDLREWCQKLDWIVQNIFGAAPLMDGHEDAKRRVGSRYLGFLRALALALEKKGRLGAQQRANDLATLCAEESIEIPGLTSTGKVSAQTPEQQIGRIMKDMFTDKATIEEEQFTITRAEESMSPLGGNWQRSPVYTFHKRGPANSPTPPV